MSRSVIAHGRLVSFGARTPAPLQGAAIGCARGIRARCACSSRVRHRACVTRAKAAIRAHIRQSPFGVRR